MYVYYSHLIAVYFLRNKIFLLGIELCDTVHTERVSVYMISMRNKQLLVTLDVTVLLDSREQNLKKDK